MVFESVRYRANHPLIPKVLNGIGKEHLPVLSPGYVQKVLEIWWTTPPTDMGAAAHWRWAARNLPACALWFLWLLASYVRVSGRPRRRSPPPAPPPAATTAVVTGSSGGIGFELARGLLAAGHHVVVTGPSRARGEAALRALQAEFPAGRAEFRALDLADDASVAAFCAAVAGPAAGRPPLGLLVNNAGTMEGGARNAGPQSAAVNCWGPLKLTAGLLALHGPVDVVNVTSFTHRAARRRELDAVLRPAGQGPALSPAAAYHASKAAALVAQAALHAARGGYRVLHVDPGAVNTRITRRWPPAFRGLYERALGPLGLLASPAEAARAVLAAAAELGSGGGGRGGGGGAGYCCYRFAPRGAVLPASRLVRELADPARAPWARDLVLANAERFLEGDLVRYRGGRAALTGRRRR